MDNHGTIMRKIGVILAGGASERMGEDKALLELGGARLIDHVFARLKKQTDLVLVSGPDAYGLPCDHLPDRPGALKGPAAGLQAAAHFLRQQDKDGGFFTAPVDAPFLPPDLIERLWSQEHSATAADASRAQPAFAWWRLDDLEAAFTTIGPRASVALKDLADNCAARSVIWEDASCFFNINRPADITAARRLLPKRALSD